MISGRLCCPSRTRSSSLVLEAAASPSLSSALEGGCGSSGALLTRGGDGIDQADDGALVALGQVSDLAELLP